MCNLDITSNTYWESEFHMKIFWNYSIKAKLNVPKLSSTTLNKGELYMTSKCNKILTHLWMLHVNFSKSQSFIWKHSGSTKCSKSIVWYFSEKQIRVELFIYGSRNFSKTIIYRYTELRCLCLKLSNFIWYQGQDRSLTCYLLEWCANLIQPALRQPAQNSTILIWIYCCLNGSKTRHEIDLQYQPL